ncbi:hypothetical protein HZH68_016055 [Vespula germanica]|uniref:Uncharacterized protein n=1 Tax=Vespula germanica TaxID=30212 RepID=A0A834MQB2_VESGE|nr:hypothetical protein HZH68_016055 [Vespula germanica]
MTLLFPNPLIWRPPIKKSDLLNRRHRCVMLPNSEPTGFILSSDRFPSSESFNFGTLANVRLSLKRKDVAYLLILCAPSSRTLETRPE